MKKLFSVAASISFILVLILPSFGNPSLKDDNPMYIHGAKVVPCPKSDHGEYKACKYCTIKGNTSGCVRYSKAEIDAATKKSIQEGLKVAEEEKKSGKRINLWD